MEDLLAGSWLDVSRPLSSGIPVWPGDRAFELLQERSPGFVLSSFSTTCHVGTHLESPFHVDPSQAAVEAIPLQRLLGRAEVVAVKPGASFVDRESLPAGWVPSGPRVLFRTDSHPLTAEIGPGFTALAPEVVGWLAANGVMVIGIDTPSVDSFESKELMAHRALLRRGMTWIEGLNLEAAEAGFYYMIALAIPLVGVEAAPVRVVLQATTNHKETDQ